MPISVLRRNVDVYMFTATIDCVFS